MATFVPRCIRIPVLFIAFNPMDSYFERLREDEA